MADEQVDWSDSDSDGEVLWGITDKQGSVADVVDSNGDLRIHRRFDSFGNIVNETHYNTSGSTVTSGQAGYVDEAFVYTGRLFDGYTDLQNNLNRWYDPRIGRWMSEDPIGFAAGDANLYRYVGTYPRMSLIHLGFNLVLTKYSVRRRYNLPYSLRPHFRPGLAYHHPTAHRFLHHQLHFLAEPIRQESFLVERGWKSLLNFCRDDLTPLKTRSLNLQKRPLAEGWKSAVEAWASRILKTRYILLIKELLLGLSVEVWEFNLVIRRGLHSIPNFLTNRLEEGTAQAQAFLKTSKINSTNVYSVKVFASHFACPSIWIDVSDTVLAGLQFDFFSTRSDFVSPVELTQTAQCQLIIVQKR
jgi:RHS repeat-associated protein